MVQKKIGGSTVNAILSTEGQSVTFVYVDSTQGWINTMDSTSNVRGLTPFRPCNWWISKPLRRLQNSYFYRSRNF